MKRKRLLFRVIILLILLCSIGYTLFMNSQSKKGISAQINKPAPNFTLNTLDDKPVSLSDFKGKALLINFWGTWCEPCKREMPLLEDSYQKYKADNFELVTINLRESNFLISSYLERNKLTVPVLLDKSATISKSYDVYNLPVTFFIDEKGVIQRIYEGELTKEALNPWIEELINSN